MINSSDHRAVTDTSSMFHPHTAYHENTTNFPPQLRSRFHSPILIGHGTFAKVYKCQDTSRSHQWIALRVVQCAPEETEIIQAEHDACLFLQRNDVACDYLVPILDIIELNPFCLAIVMPLYEYGDLEHFISELVLKKQQQQHTPMGYYVLILQIMIQLTIALNIVHRQGHCHCDLSLKNIFVKHYDDKLQQVQIVLGDFGMVLSTENTLTLSQRRGTLEYLPPDALHERRYSPKTDYWSLGVVLFKLLFPNSVNSISICNLAAECGTSMTMSNPLRHSMTSVHAPSGHPFMNPMIPVEQQWEFLLSQTVFQATQKEGMNFTPEIRSSSNMDPASVHFHSFHHPPHFNNQMDSMNFHQCLHVLLCQILGALLRYKREERMNTINVLELLGLCASLLCFQDDYKLIPISKWNASPMKRFFQTCKTIQQGIDLLKDPYFHRIKKHLTHAEKIFESIKSTNSSDSCTGHLLEQFLAIYHIQQQQYEQALDHLEKSLKAIKNPITLSLKYSCMMQLGSHHFNTVIDGFTDLIQRVGPHPMFFFQRAMMYCRSNDRQDILKGIQDLRMARQLCPESLAIHYVLASIYSGIGEISQLKQVLLDMMSVFRGQEETNDALKFVASIMNRECGEFQNALNYATPLARKYRNSPLYILCAQLFKYLRNDKMSRLYISMALQVEPTCTLAHRFKLQTLMYFNALLSDQKLAEQQWRELTNTKKETISMFPVEVLPLFPDGSPYVIVPMALLLNDKPPASSDSTFTNFGNPLWMTNYNHSFQPSNSQFHASHASSSWMQPPSSSFIHTLNQNPYMAFQNPQQVHQNFQYPPNVTQSHVSWMQPQTHHPTMNHNHSFHSLMPSSSLLMTTPGMNSTSPSPLMDSMNGSPIQGVQPVSSRPSSSPLLTRKIIIRKMESNAKYFLNLEASEWTCIKQVLLKVNQLLQQRALELNMEHVERVSLMDETQKSIITDSSQLFENVTYVALTRAQQLELEQ
ncbi:hypothetical protein C9374_002966 [Naegleria lovaniensis]|uniref:Protein kinase domain-containing protein n=1 Tax=Naegleria lovaniensis TaxID=51637 RepID=A0AA88GRQ6_NAELO|nr:uncharacterized protein C9374_002966 [Naegleria lovaniensis]KAG2385817.1 hypothetical protein C9374_002966 [Naegleria lovaniensis]